MAPRIKGMALPDDCTDVDWGTPVKRGTRTAKAKPRKAKRPANDQPKFNRIKNKAKRARAWASWQATKRQDKQEAKDQRENVAYASWLVDREFALSGVPVPAHDRARRTVGNATQPSKA